MAEGLSPTGMVVDTTDQTLTKIEQDELAAIDAALDTSPEEPLGQLNGIYASDRSLLAQLVQASYAARDVNNAEGQQLDVLCALTGTRREPASSTRVIVSASIDKGHVFTTATLDKNGNVSAAGQLQAQIVGHPEFVFTFVGQQIVGVGIVLGGVLDTTGASGTLSYGLVFECTQTGAIACNAGTLTVISPSVGGFNSITNGVDAYQLGANVESDPALRLRRDAELTPPGGGTFESLRRSIGPQDGNGNGVAGVISAQLLVNDTDITDGNGLPPHSFEAIIWDGAIPAALPNDIAQAIWDAKPAGVRSYDGASGLSGVAKDGTGKSQTVGFNRATQDSYYIAISVKVNSLYPSNGDTLLAAALVAFGNLLKVGDPVIMWAFGVAAAQIAGITDMTLLKIDTASTPLNTLDIVTLPTHIARFDTSRVVVSHV